MATEFEYVLGATEVKERYDRIKAIIAALEVQQLAIVGNSDVVSYSLDDGQTRITTTYRSSEQIAKAINDYERIAIRLEHQLTGTRIVRLADAKTIQSNRFIQ